jgi:hypothetical protein
MGYEEKNLNGGTKIMTKRKIAVSQRNTVKTSNFLSITPRIGRVF